MQTACLSGKAPFFDFQSRGPLRAEGGLEAERAERLQAKAKEEEKERCRFATLQRIRQDGFRKVCSCVCSCMLILQCLALCECLLCHNAPHIFL